MKETTQKKKGTIKKFFSRLIGRGGHEDDEAADAAQSSFQRGHASRQTAPPGISHAARQTTLSGTSQGQEHPQATLSNEDITQKGRNQPLGCHPSLSQEALQECGDSALTGSKMPVIKRALSPIEGVAGLDPGEVETTVYRSYRRRSRTATSINPKPAAPLAAVCPETLLTKHGEELAAGATVPSPPVPPSKIPDFKLHLAAQEPLVVPKQREINKGIHQSAVNASALHMTRSSVSKDSRPVSLNTCSSSEDTMIRSCQSERQLALSNPIVCNTIDIIDKKDHQTVACQGDRLSINNKNVTRSETLVSNDTTTNCSTTDPQINKHYQTNLHNVSDIKQPVSDKTSLMDSNTFKSQMDKVNKRTESVEGKQGKTSSVAKATKQKRQLPAIPSNVQPVLVSDRTKIPTLRKDNEAINKQTVSDEKQISKQHINAEQSEFSHVTGSTNMTQQTHSRTQLRTKPNDTLQNHNSVLGGKNSSLAEKKIHGQNETTHFSGLPTSKSKVRSPSSQTRVESRSSTMESSINRTKNTHSTSENEVHSLEGKLNHQRKETPNNLETRLKTSDFKNSAYLTKVRNSTNSHIPSTDSYKRNTPKNHSSTNMKARVSSNDRTEPEKGSESTKNAQPSTEGVLNENSNTRPAEGITVHKPAVSVSHTAAHMIKQARLQKATQGKDRKVAELTVAHQQSKSPSLHETKRVCSGEMNERLQKSSKGKDRKVAELHVTHQHSVAESTTPSPHETSLECSGDSSEGIKRTPNMGAPTKVCANSNTTNPQFFKKQVQTGRTHSSQNAPKGGRDESSTGNSSSNKHDDIYHPKQQVKEPVQEYANEPVKLKPRGEINKTVHPETKEDAKHEQLPTPDVQNQVLTSLTVDKRVDNVRLDCSTPTVHCSNKIPVKHYGTAEASQNPPAPTKSRLAPTQNTDHSKPVKLKATTSGKHVNVKQALTANEQSDGIKTDANVNTFGVSVHNKMDYGHTVIVSQEVKIQNKEDKSTNIFPVKVKKQTITPNSSNVNETQKERDFLDISLTNLDEDFSKPLASSTLQRKSKAKNTIESSNTSSLSNTQLNSENQETNKINGKNTPQISRRDVMRESIRQKRLQYFNSQASNPATVVANTNTVALCTGQSLRDQATALLPQQNYASISTKGVIDPNINIHKGTLPSNSSGTKVRSVLHVNEDALTTVSQQGPLGASCGQENQRETVITKHTASAACSLAEGYTNNNSLNSDKTTQQIAVGDEDINSTHEHTLVDGDNVQHMDTDTQENTIHETEEFENTITAHIDSTIVLPDDESLLETTLTVSHGNPEIITPTPSLLEENMADISSVTALRNNILRYQLTIQDNCNGININVNRTSERPVLDLMDVSQEGIQRLQLQENSFVNESERSYAINPEIPFSASTETLASTIVADDWQVSYVPDTTTFLVNSDAFLQDDSISDITCDTTYLMDADAWGQFDDEPEHNTTLGTCDPVADPLHMNCRLRHIPLEGQTNPVVSAPASPITRNAPLRSSRGGYPWQRYQDLHRSRSNVFIPPWRSGTTTQQTQNSQNAQSQHGQNPPTTPSQNEERPQNTQLPQEARVQSSQQQTSVRSSSVLRTLVRPGSRRYSSTDSVTAAETSVRYSSTDSVTTTADSSTVAPAGVYTNTAPVNSASPGLPTSVSASGDTSRRASLNSTESTLSVASSENETQAQSLYTPSSITMATSGYSATPSVSRATADVTAAPLRTPSRSVGYTNAIIEELHNESLDNIQTSEAQASNKGKSKKNLRKGKSISQKCMERRDAERPVAVVVPRQRTSVTSSSTAVTSHSASQSRISTPAATSISAAPSLHISSTVSIGSTFSAFTPRSFPYRSLPYSHTRPASAIPSTESISPLPTASTFTTSRSLTPAANSTLDLITRPAFGDGLSRESLLSQDDSVVGSTASVSTADMIRAVNRRIPSSRDDTQLQSGSDFVFVDEDVTDVSSRQAFRRSGLASTIQPSMRRARSINPAGRRNDNEEPNLTADSLRSGRSLEETVAALRDDIVRVPGALILSVRRNRLVVYLSQDRPNVEGVIRFMQQHGMSRADYEVEILPWGPNSTRTPARTMRAVSSQVAS